MKAFKLGIAQTEGVNVVKSTEDLVSQYHEVFSEQLGTFHGVTASISVQKGAKPRFVKARPIPFALRDRVFEELQRMEREGVIKPVKTSQWAAPIVPVLKRDGRVRVCGDFKTTINPVTVVESYPIPRIEELFARLTGGKKFTKLDLQDAYQQVPLDEECQELVTINTPKGLYQFTRLPFGVSSAPAIFQREMENLLHDLDHVVVYFDDILVTGTSDKEHWENLGRVLDRLKTAGLRLKLSKCEFMKPEVQYLGHIISAAGLRPNPAKTEAVLEAPAPRAVKELQSYLGLVNFYRRFLPNLSAVLQPLNSLLASGTPWRWETDEKQAFRRSKELLASAAILAHFDPGKPTVLVTDASPFGIGAVLAQRESSGEERPIGFASRSLATAEKNYSQLDKEALSLVFGVTKFRQYLWGRQFEAVTDHKPLLGLLAADKPVPESCSPRVLRWALLLSGYSYDLKYRPGSQIAHADGLSRLPLPTAEFVVDCPAEVLMLEGVYPGVLSSNAVAAATSRDPVLSQVRAALWSGCQINLGSEGRPYETRFHEMSVQGNCLLWGNRVIVPKSLQKEVLQLLHESHPGLSKMKAVARSHVWWPSLDNDIAITIQRCRICQEHQRVSRPVPVMPWPFPEKPWSRLHVDYAGPYRNTYFFIAVDAFSKWIEVFPVSTPSAEATISCMRIMFANQGLPDVVVSDNGPAFTSELYSTFLKKNGVRRMLVPPYHPASNGAAERAVQTVKNKLRKAGPGDIRTQIARMLLTYRSTPHEVTGCCPSELLLGRKLRTALDLLHPDLRTKVLQKQLKQKIRCDQGTRPRVLGHPGDQVFARNFRPGPAWLPAVVTEQRTSSMDVLLEDGRRLTRHLDHIRQAPEELSADNQKSGSPVSTGLAPSLDVGQTQLTGLAPGLDVGQRQLSPDRLHDTESRQDPREDVAREPELAVTAPSTPVLRRSTRIRRPVSRYAP